MLTPNASPLPLLSPRSPRHRTLDHGLVKQRYQAATATASTKREKLVEFIKEMMAELPPMLHYWFVDTFRAPSAWFEARLAFTRSCAVTSMIGYSVGLGDRHLENILIEKTTGSLMHVDFACLFDHGLNLETPEKVHARRARTLPASRPSSRPSARLSSRLSFSSPHLSARLVSSRHLTAPHLAHPLIASSAPHPPPPLA